MEIADIFSVLNQQIPGGGIGKNNKLLYNWTEVPLDKDQFKTLSIGTSGNINITGRINFESIPKKFRPFGDGRITIVVSHDEHPEIEAFENCFVKKSPLEALELALFLKERTYQNKKIAVIGGGEIYRQLFPYCQKIYATNVKGHREADVFVHIPEYFKLVSEELKSEQEPRYSFAEYENTKLLVL